LSQTIFKTEKASFHLFCVRLICSVIIITLNTLTFYHSDITHAQLLESWPKQCNLLEKGVIVSSYRKRQSDIATYYSMDGNIQELMEKLQLERTSEQWRLFIDSPTVRLMALLLHNWNNFPYILLAHAVHAKVHTLRFCCKKTLWRTLLEYMFWPKCYCNADWAARHIHYVLSLLMLAAERGTATSE
jgi:hypothetical protein